MNDNRPPPIDLEPYWLSLSVVESEIGELTEKLFAAHRKRNLYRALIKSCEQEDAKR